MSATPIATNSADYYSDESQWGNYQYVTIEMIMNNREMSIVDDDYTISTPRHKVLYQARRGLRELYYDVLREIKAIRLELSPSLMVTLPPDYINYCRISWINDDGELVPMALNEKIDISKSYLQDNDYNLLYDADGCVLQDNSSPTVATGTDGDSLTATSQDLYLYNFSRTAFQPNRNMTNTYKDGGYKIDKGRGIISFGSEVFGKEIVLEYISDGLYTGCEGRPESEIRINKFAEMALIDFIYYNLIKTRRNTSVPAVEKERARKEWFNSRRIAKRRINTLRVAELIQAFKGDGRWVK